MITEQKYFKNPGMMLENLGEKKQKTHKKIGFKVGDQYMAKVEMFLYPIECKLLKIYDHSALVGIIKTNHKADFLKSVELEGKTVVNFKNFQYELKKEK